jgi:glycosyltransferase involved in cell wall biosynthesis
MPKIFYSTGSNIGGTGLSNVAFQAVKAIYDAGYLSGVVTYKNRQSYIPKTYVNTTLFHPYKLFSSLPSRYYYSMKREWIDRKTARILHKYDCDIFHGWTHESLESLRVNRSLGRIGILERGYCHPRFSRSILDEEYETYGIKRALREAPRLLNRYDHWRRELEEACYEFEEADYIILNSQFSRKTFVDEGVSPEKLIYIPRGYNPVQFKKSIRSDKKFRVLFVGQLLVRKGLLYLLKAWDALRLPNAELVIVGQPMDETRNILSRYVGRKDIVFKGFIPDPAAEYQQADVFVLPTLDEGSAKVVYEAMACGLPCIVTANAGSTIRNEIDGLIINIRSAHEVAAAICRLYEDRDFRCYISQAATDAAANYTWEKYGERLTSAYRALIELRSRGCHP